MKLKNLNQSRAATAVRALRENYNINFSLDKLSRKNTQFMLNKVRQQITENKHTTGQSGRVHGHDNMKLIFMEQALASHLADLNSRVPQIVVENTVVDQSQVYLAAQEMAKSLQDMVEELSDMLNKELPALIQTSEGKIDENLRQSFEKNSTEILQGMLNGLRDGTKRMNGAVNTLTGTGGAGAAEPAQPMAGMGAEQQPEMPAPAPAEEPEMPATPGAGRTRR